MDTPETANPSPFVNKEGLETYSSLKQAASVKGISLVTLKAAKNLGCPGFQSNGRITWTKDLDSWLSANGPACEEESLNNKEHWSREKLKWDAKRSEV